MNYEDIFKRYWLLTYRMLFFISTKGVTQVEIK